MNQILSEIPVGKALFDKQLRMFKKLKVWYTQNKDGKEMNIGEANVVQIANGVKNDATILTLNLKTESLNEECRCLIFILICQFAHSMSTRLSFFKAAVITKLRQDGVAWSIEMEI